MSEFKPGLKDFSFPDLFQLDGLQRLDQEFLARLKQRHSQRHVQLLAYRQGETFTPTEVSELLLDCAPVLEELVGDLFNIRPQLEAARERTLSHDPVFVFKKNFVQKRARRRLNAKESLAPFAELDAWLTQALQHAKLEASDRELAVARYAQQLLKNEAAQAQDIEQLTLWCVQAMKTPEGQKAVRHWVGFRLPQPMNHARLVPITPLAQDKAGRVQLPEEMLRQRDGFKLTDRRMSEREIQNEINYCIYCHDHDGDFCSKGFPEKKGEPDKGLKVNALDVTLTGCPLDEKISEMHLLKKQGHTLGALAMITVDNPLCAATGHRICNDCMKGCIYQKQDPVNIPQAETGILTDVLDLPWGVEIYDLLIRWNPLRQRQWLPKPYNGLKVLILGMGPAGFTLTHHMLMEGFGVVGIEGLKIEPLPPELVAGPIRDYAQLEEELDTRIMTGFGGVAEYGITNRWDKNFLKLIYLSLSRRPRLQIFGGVRFGGTLTIEDAWELGFDHVAVAIGAGLPQALPIPGSLAPGMRQANDFLMALQLTGGAKESSLANLQVRLPAVVIGGGLTGVDTATEVQAYYIAQVEKTLVRYEKLVGAYGDKHVRAKLDDNSNTILDEFLAHGRMVRAERARAEKAGDVPDFLKLIRAWGGVTIAYRRSMNESPAYTRNHEEIIKAMEEGIYYVEGLNPTEARVDAAGHVENLVTRRMREGEDGKWVDTGEEVILPARSILVATGAKPNVAYEFEHRGHFAKEHGHYQTFHEVKGKLEPLAVAPHCKVDDFGAFTSYAHADKRVSFIGDTHPVFHGSVVKAIASGMRTYPKILQSLGERVNTRGDMKEYEGFRGRMQHLLQARVEKVVRHTDSVVEVRVHAPMAVKKFQPGQFFRLQNFEAHAPMVEGSRLQTEALAMTGAKANVETGHISLFVLELGASSRLCATLRPGEPIALMGPTGVRTAIPGGHETTMIIGGRRGAAHVLGVGPAMRAAGNRVLYIAGFPSADEVFCQDDLEAAADVIVWVTEQGEPIKPRRPNDRSATGNILDIIVRYAQGKLEPTGDTAPISLQEVDHLLVIGSNRLVRLIRDARRGVLHDYLSKGPHTIASTSTPMQCMLKGVCSQCLQWQIDPVTGKRTKAVFSCSWQDQPLDIIDLDNLDERLVQNQVQEHLTNLWLDYLFEQGKVTRA